MYVCNLNKVITIIQFCMCIYSFHVFSCNNIIYTIIGIKYFMITGIHTHMANNNTT